MINLAHLEDTTDGWCVGRFSALRGVSKERHRRGCPSFRTQIEPPGFVVSIMREMVGLEVYLRTGRSEPNGDLITRGAEKGLENVAQEDVGTGSDGVFTRDT
jgi:hypothetical protein